MSFFTPYYSFFLIFILLSEHISTHVLHFVCIFAKIDSRKHAKMKKKSRKFPQKRRKVDFSISFFKKGKTMSATCETKGPNLWKYFDDIILQISAKNFCENVKKVIIISTLEHHCPRCIEWQDTVCSRQCNVYSFLNSGPKDRGTETI